MDSNDEIFYLALTASLVTFFGLTVRFCLKSKCDLVELCYGCLRVHRNVNLELPEIPSQQNMV